MKTPFTHPKALLVPGIAAALALTSCADPYATSYGPAPTVSHHHVGYEVRTLPRGYRTETYNGDSYYFYQGTYYRPRHGGYVVVDPPRRPSYGRPPYDRHDDRHDNHRDDRSFDRIPPGARTVRHDGETYYVVNGRYYERRGSRYVQVDRPR